jgi:transcriptional regulator with XRE-family HTH domain
MLRSLLAEKMRKEQFSARDAARQIGISHTTVNRVLDGDIPNVENLVAISNWLGVSVATALGVETGTKDDVAARVALLIEAEPRLKQLFGSLVKGYQDGRLTSEDIEDIFAYAAYRIQRKGNSDEQRTENALPSVTVVQSEAES